jgi:LPS-assembly protein
MQAQPHSIGHRVPETGFGIWIAWSVFFLICLTAPCGHAQNAQADNDDWEITADRLTYDQATETFTAEGNVRITRQGRVLTADTVRVDQLSGMAWAEGNVSLLSGLDRLTGRSLELSLRDETGALHEGKVFLSENNVHVTGERILKTGPQTYYVRQASVTTCDGPDPDWRITGRDLHVTIEGYGTVKHAAFRAADIPILYTPYFIFPVKLRRQSGLLLPDVGFSDRRGAEYLQPFFWAISDHMDATVFAHYMDERGLRLGAEYRYMASERSLGTLLADGFRDRRIDDGLSDRSSRWGYTDDAFLRTNTDRYWVRGKINQDLPWAMTAKVDLDVVSDQDYLHDFRSGIGGFDETRTVFLRSYGRDLPDFTEPLRNNQLNVNRLWTSYSFNGNLRWHHDAVRTRPPEDFTPLQNLPEITLDGIKQKIGHSPFYYNLGSSYTYLYREQGDRTHRADIYPRVYYPSRLFDAFTVEPSLGIRQTAWYLDHYETTPETADRDHYRTLYDFRLDTGTDLYRIYTIEAAGNDRLKHNIRPQLIYQYIPDEDQEDLPLFDTLDRIGEQNLITFALTQTLVARRTAGTNDRPPVYTPFLRFRLEESFDINRYKDNAPRPFSDLLAELDFYPGQYVRLDADARWRPYDGEFYAYNTALQLWNRRGDRLALEYRFTRAEEDWTGVKSINATAIWQATHRWQLRGKYERNLAASQLLETGAGITYMAQCWGVDFDYRMDAENNSSFAFRVNLAGLGSIGR